MSIEKDQWIVVSIIAGLVLVFVLGVWMPENRKLAHHQERIEIAELALGPNFNQPAALAARMEEVDELKTKMDASDRFVSAEPELADLLRSLTEAATANDIDEQEFNTRSSRNFMHYSEIPVELDARGSFEAVYGLLEAIETMPRVVRIDGLNLRAISRESNRAQPEMQATFRISGFFTERQGGGS